MSGQVAIQRLKPGVYEIRYRKGGKMHRRHAADARGACEIAARILLGEA